MDGMTIKFDLITVRPLTCSLYCHHNRNHKTLLHTLQTVCKSEKGNAEQY